MKEKFKMNKGITLIALIITIIVLLILAAVSIKLVWNGGIITHAQIAANKTNKAITEEQSQLALLELKMGADDLIKKYPLHCKTSYKTIELLDTNVIDLYGYILEKLNAKYETLTLSQSIQASNIFYEIYDKEVQKYTNDDKLEEEWIKENFWNVLKGKVVDGDITFSEESVEGITLEQYNKLIQINMSFGIPNIENSALFHGIDKNGKNYLMITCRYGDEGGNVAEEINTEWATSFPGGVVPTDIITGTTVSDFSLFINLSEEQNEQLMKITKENINQIQLFKGTEEIKNKEDYLESIALSFIADNGSTAAFLCHNIFIINKQNGEIVYIDDNGKPNKAFL